MRPAALGIGPTDNDELLAIEALGLDPDPAVAGGVGSIRSLRDGAFETKLAGRCAVRQAIRTIRELLRSVAATEDEVLDSMAGLR